MRGRNVVRVGQRRNAIGKSCDVRAVQSNTPSSATSSAITATVLPLTFAATHGHRDGRLQMNGSTPPTSHPSNR
jgi:hypothetical protein